MKKSVIFLLLALAVPGVCCAADTMREGYWELVSTMEMPGMPMKIPPTTVKHCYTKEDVKDQKRTITTDKNCTVTDMTKTGSKVTWKMKCTGNNAGTFNGETVFKGDAFDSTMKMQSESRTMNMKINARRLGDCP